ncbi:MAG: rhodanese-like domain-containing protein [Ignavibacteria bacterium]
MKKNFSVILALAVFSGCLKDDINVPSDIELSSGVEFLKYLEEQGDYINTPEVPSLINAAEVYANLQNYLIIDVRTNGEFVNGHIQGAVNVNNTELLNFILTGNAASYQKIVLVSQDGQSSAYYTCLLRLYGFNNVYTMKFGMAYWNMDFSQVWLQKIKDSPNLNFYTTEDYPKNQFKDLPSVFEGSSGGIQELAKQRIASFIARGFIDWVDDIEETAVGNSIYLVCYGKSVLYEEGHPPNTVFYLESEHLKSVKDLQTMPPDKEILIYDYNGQLSAAVTAYLQVLGYNAKSFLFGANQLIYSSMAYGLDTRLRPYAFLPEEINNFPYVTGE